MEIGNRITSIRYICHRRFVGHYLLHVLDLVLIYDIERFHQVSRNCMYAKYILFVAWIVSDGMNVSATAPTIAQSYKPVVATESLDVRHFAH